MGQLLADRRDVDFVLFEQMNVEQFTKFDKFADFGKKTIDMIISRQDPSQSKFFQHRYLAMLKDVNSTLAR